MRVRFGLLVLVFFWFIWGVDSFKTFWCPERVEMFVISYHFLLIAMA